jgi:hypothetical protein
MEIPILFRRFEGEDDEECWKVALDEILADVKPGPGALVEIGRCSHWLRPHQCRWTAAGGFAMPQGYNPTVFTHTRKSLPQFDWSLKLVRDKDGNWTPTRGRGLPHVECRITVPARTKRHKQAAVHVLWTDSKHKRQDYYGFRKQDDGSWKMVATTSSHIPHKEGNDEHD